MPYNTFVDLRHLQFLLVHASVFNLPTNLFFRYTVIMMDILSLMV